MTSREVDVLLLITAGKSNLEIADELVIAEGTARRHVANIYEKINATNRVEAAAYANQHNLVEMAIALQEKGGAAAGAPTAYPDGLTQREVEVLRLLVVGKSNQDVAAELVISINTVGNHVRSILNKTNSANRTEAATYAAQKGLLLAHPDGLSSREVEVLRLVALGKSNPEIAELLLISPNTVAHHVTNILNKTSTSNRTEAAIYAAQHELL